MENNQNNNLKNTNNKILIASAIVLILTLILGMIFIFNVNNDFVLTKTIWGEMTSSLDGNNPGAGELFLISAFVSGLTFLGELGLLLVIIFLYLITPVASNLLLLVINTIARLFQIGKYKVWKKNVTLVLLYLSIILQGILTLYLLFLAFSGIGLVYITIYIMLLVNAFTFIKNIINLKKLNNNLKQAKELSEQ